MERVYQISLMALLVLLSACDKNQNDESKDVSETPTSMASTVNVAKTTMSTLADKQFLLSNDSTDPAEWLLARYQKQAGYDPKRTKEYYKKRIDQIEPHVAENERYVANRVVQITQMLHEENISASEDEILQSFAVLLGKEHKNYILSDLLAEYNNLRQTNMTHQQAMAFLAKHLHA